jgi:hypothetical protein
MLANIIRRDAGEQTRRSKTDVTVTQRCCGVRVLRVHYRAQTRRGTKHDAYVLSVETRRSVLLGVAISESGFEVGYSSNTGRWKNGWDSDLAIHRESHRSSNGWSFTRSYSETSRVEHGIGGQPSGLGLGRECGSFAPVPRALVREAMLMLERARWHVPTSSGPPSLSACRANP